MQAKLNQFFHPGKLYNKPAMQLKGSWAPDAKGKGKVSVAEEIVGFWVGSQVRRRKEEEADENTSVLASKMIAMGHERKLLKQGKLQEALEEPLDDQPKKAGEKGTPILPYKGERHLGKFLSAIEPVLTQSYVDHRNEKGHEDVYHDAMVRVLLQAVGEKDIDAVLESFKEAGTGGLHRHGATMLAATGNLVNAAQVLDPEPISKAVLTGVRFALILASGREALASWDQRLGNAQTEELMVKGRADAPHSAKIAPDMVKASWNVFTEIWGSKKTIQQIQNAVQKVDTVRAAHEEFLKTWAGKGKAKNELTPEEQIAFDKSEMPVLAAEANLRKVHAKMCHQIDVKSKYKASSETAKVEFIGNKRYFQTGFASAGLTSAAALFGILTPIVGGFVTGGISTGAAVAALAIYLAYHFSNMPSDDGVRKAMRAIVALAKSSDLFNDDRLKFDMRRASAYEKYQDQRSKAKLSLNPPAAKAAAMTELNKTLLDIAEDEKKAEKAKQEKGEGDINSPITPKQNWKNYRKYLRDMETLAGPEKAKAHAEFKATCAAAFKSGVIMSGWKDAVSMRMDTGRKLLTGKIAQLQRLIKEEDTRPNVLRKGPPRDKDWRKQKLVANLQQCIADLLNLEAAERVVKKAAKLPLEVFDENSPEADANKERLENAFKPATRFLAAIKDEDFRNLFCGDTEAQVAASKKAKVLTTGEAERYKWTNWGNAGVALTISASVATADLGIAVAKALPPDPPAHPATGADGTAPSHAPQDKPTGQYHGLKFADYKFLGVQALGAPLNGHYNAGTRTKIRDVDLKKLLKAIQSQATSFTHELAWPKQGTFTADEVNVLLTNMLAVEGGKATMPSVKVENASTENAEEADDKTKQEPTFDDELRFLLTRLAEQNDFKERLGLLPQATYTVAEIKDLVAELVTKESFVLTLDVPEKDGKKLTAEQIREFAIAMQRKEKFAAELDFPDEGTFTAAQMQGLVANLMDRDTIPKDIKISFGKPSSAPSTSTQPAAPIPDAIKISLEKSVPFVEEQREQAPLRERMRYRRKEASIVGRQAAITLLGIPAQLLAQLSLKHGATLDDMKDARNTGADNMKNADTTPPSTEEDATAPKTPSRATTSTRRTMTAASLSAARSQLRSVPEWIELDDKIAIGPTVLKADSSKA